MSSLDPGPPARPPAANGDMDAATETASGKICLADLRQDYRQNTLTEDSILGDPFAQFDAWFAEAHATLSVEANAMTLATCAPDTGRPSARIVLLKHVDPDTGFFFYTNTRSRKAAELHANPWVALCFHWGERQVRVEGKAVPLEAAEAAAYFASRPRGSQIGAWVSERQSSVVPSRDALDKAAAATAERFSGTGDIPMPPFWGGYRVVPDRVEFWQGRQSRLHDRLVFERSGSSWSLSRLSP